MNGRYTSIVGNKILEKIKIVFSLWIDFVKVFISLGYVVIIR